MHTDPKARLGGPQTVLFLTVLAAGCAQQMTVELEAANPSEYRRLRLVCSYARAALSGLGADTRAAVNETLELIG